MHGAAMITNNKNIFCLQLVLSQSVIDLSHCSIVIEVT